MTPSYVREAEVAAHTAADTVGLQANEVRVEVAPPVQDLDYHLQVFC